LGADRKNESLLEDYRDVRESFISGIRVVIASIFSRKEPFRMTKTVSRCNYCPYRGLCRR